MDIFNEIKQKILANKSEKKPQAKESMMQNEEQIGIVKPKERALKKKYNNILNQEYYSLGSLFWYVDVVEDKARVKMLYAVPKTDSSAENQSAVTIKNQFSKSLLFRPQRVIRNKSIFTEVFDFYDVASNQIVEIKDSEKQLFKFCDFDDFCIIYYYKVDYKNTSLVLRPKGYYVGDFSPKYLEKYGYAVTKFCKPLYVFDPSVRVSGRVTINLSGLGSFRYSYSGNPEERQRALGCVCFNKKMIEKMVEETEQNLNQQIFKYSLKDKVLIR